MGGLLSRFFNRGNAVRAVVLLAIGALAFSLAHGFPSAQSTPAPTAQVERAERVVVQPEAAGTTLVPAPTPTVTPTPAPVRTQAKAPARHLVTRSTRHSVRHAHRKARARHAARRRARLRAARHAAHGHHAAHRTRHPSKHAAKHPSKHAAHHKTTHKVVHKAKHHVAHRPKHHVVHRPKHHVVHRAKHHVVHRPKHHVLHRAKHHAKKPARDPWRSKGGRDIGWPQCPSNVGFRGRNGLGQPMPDRGVQFVMIGVTNGRAFTPNPCLDMHLRWVREHHVHASAYAFATYPNRPQLRRYRFSGPYFGWTTFGGLANAGYAAARYNIATMHRHGFTTPHIWLDLEPSSSRPWSRHRSWNRVVVRGWVRAYEEAGYTVGFYSTVNLWHEIVGDLRLGLPEWRTAGPVSPRTALAKCRGESIQGGPAVIAQWWTDRRDFDRMCPGPSLSTTMEHYFHQW